MANEGVWVGKRPSEAGNYLLWLPKSMHANPYKNGFKNPHVRMINNCDNPIPIVAMFEGYERTHGIPWTELFFIPPQPFYPVDDPIEYLRIDDPRLDGALWYKLPSAGPDKDVVSVPWSLDDFLRDSGQLEFLQPYH